MWNRTIFAWLLHPSISTRLLDGKLAILHIGKTGGSELMRRLRYVETDRLIFLTHDFAQVAFRDGRCRLGRNRQFAFFVRDPVRRFVSGWIERYRMGRPNYFEAHSGLEALSFARFPTPDILGCALSSTDASVAGDARAAMGAHRHLAGLSHYLGNLSSVASCSSRIFFMGRTEHLHEDYSRLLQLLEARQVLSAEAATRSLGGRLHAMPPELANLTRLGTCALRNLLSWFGDDYRLIRYMVRRGALPASYLAELSSLAEAEA
mmetsp:Transcript_8950/g.17921  ORF Transcript_8950/g.17921 Transcript_8950/m.17921 type:complete len:263 (+) Transcript_8950:60-848(+)